MNKLRMSLENIQGKLSRKEMRNIMAGSAGSLGCDNSCTSSSDCGPNCQHCKQTVVGKICTMYA